ncbi:hypothetical protein [Streptomyces sp. PU-14G]|uniref:hypothetical protein n=1 Tax=Streptomyces sp. PU-14G TaxID=2800808 RepID=UPI0034DE8FD7
MSFFRRAAVTSVIALTMATFGGAGAAMAASPDTQAARATAAQGGDWGRPGSVRFGPFEVPRYGQVSGGFGWSF